MADKSGTSKLDLRDTPWLVETSNTARGTQHGDSTRYFGAPLLDKPRVQGAVASQSE